MKRSAKDKIDDSVVLFGLSACEYFCAWSTTNEFFYRRVIYKRYQFKRWWRKSTYYFGKEIPFEHLASRTGSFHHFHPIRVLIHKQNHKFCLKNHSMIINLRIATAVGERNTACVLREKYCDHRKKSQQLAVFVFSAIRHLMRGKQPPLFFGINYYK